MIHQQTIEVRTTGHRNMHDLTDQVSDIVRDSKIKTGTVHVFTRQFILEIAFNNREVFAYACEAYAQVVLRTMAGSWRGGSRS